MYLWCVFMAFAMSHKRMFPILVLLLLLYSCTLGIFIDYPTSSLYICKIISHFISFINTGMTIYPN